MDALSNKVPWKMKIKFRENVVDDFFRDSTVYQVLRWHTVPKDVKNNLFNGVILLLRYW